MTHTKENTGKAWLGAAQKPDSQPNQPCQRALRSAEADLLIRLSRLCVTVSNMLSSWCQYEALSYVTFPTQASQKPIQCTRHIYLRVC
jgi:hypothetical protein